jgi:hypothetical protein
VSLEEAIENSKRLGEDYRLVGYPKPKKIKQKRPKPAKPPKAPVELWTAPPLPAPKLSNSDGDKQPPAPREKGPKGPKGLAMTKAGRAKVASKPPAGHQVKLIVLALQFASVFCATLIPLSYLLFDGTVLMFVLMAVSASVILGTIGLTLTERRKKEPAKPVEQPVPNTTEGETPEDESEAPAGVSL